MSLFARLFRNQRPSPIKDVGGGVLEITAVELRGGRDVPVVGESNYQQQLENACGGRTTESASFMTTAVLMREPDNRFDPYAVAVYIQDGGIVGYLSRRDAVEYGPLLERLAREKRFGCCRAVIKGGWDKGPGDRGHFGIVLDLAPPEDALDDD